MNKSKNTFYIETFGCQMNVNDSERVAGLLEAEGYRPAESAGAADFVFLNTCAVRERAADKLYHSLGRLRKLRTTRPGLVIGVGGCVAQLEGRAVLARAPQVDILVGTHNLNRIPDLLKQKREGSGELIDLDRKADSFAVPASLVAHSSRVRAYVTAMEGCNHVCSFCVVPRTRGPEVCRPADDIVSEVELLVARGYSEVMLLGQTVNAYRFGEVDFVSLLSRVDAVRGLRRLRFTTSHPEHVTEAMAKAFRDLDRLCPSLHLPVQSGSDQVLASMRRGYTVEEYRGRVAMLRDRVPDLALSTDIIVGYPGETEGDFQASLDLLAEIGFEGLFAFTYSPRPGTTAVRLRDDVPEPEKGRRLQRLNEQQQASQALRNASRLGSMDTVLVDTVSGSGRLSGRTPHFRIVHFDGPAALLGRLVEVEVTGSGHNSLTGRISPSGSLTASSADPIL
jgi:tRNA-2-methylthio-N6-dimethylallyladenosine synthase